MLLLIYTVAAWALLLSGIATESFLDSDGVEKAISLYLENLKPSSKSSLNLKKKNTVDLKPLEGSVYQKIFPEVEHHKVDAGVLSSVDDPSLDSK
jgi:hypothetical protein